jgi:hypothetical protein
MICLQIKQIGPRHIENWLECEKIGLNILKRRATLAGYWQALDRGEDEKN